MRLATLLASTTACVVGADVYCDPIKGSDSNAGTLASPFQTLACAQKAVRAAPKTPGKDTNVFLSPGTYFLDAPLKFGPGDSGVDGGIVHWQKLPQSDGQVVVSGGRKLTDWTKMPNKTTSAITADISVAKAGDCAADYHSSAPCCGQPGQPVPTSYQCPAQTPHCVEYVYGKHYGHCEGTPVPPTPIYYSDVTHLKGKAQFRHLFVNDRRAARTFLAGEQISATFTGSATSAAGYLIKSTDALKWNVGEKGHGVEFRYPQQGSPWTEAHCGVDNITAMGDGQAMIYLAQPCGYNLLHKPCNQGDKSPPRGVENVGINFLTDPGQWVYEASSSKVYYMPLPGEDMTTADVIMPVLEQLVVGSNAANIRFTGITFAHATWLRPHQGDGYVEQQSGACIIGHDPNNGDCNHDELWMASPACLSFTGTTSITFDTCEYKHMGGVAVGFQGGAHNNVVDNCYFHGLSGTAVQIGRYNTANLTDAPKQEVGNVVRNSLIVGMGSLQEFKGMCAIEVGYTAGTVIEHNDVSNLTYGGISVGWGWNRHPVSYASNNSIAYNRVHNYKQELNDGGGIYMLGIQNGSDIHHNWVHHQSTSSSGALYPDEGSAYSHWHNNVVTSIGKSEWLHLWTGSIHDITVDNNWVDTSKYLNHGTRCPMINNTVFDSSKPAPATAQAIMDGAGVDKDSPWPVPAGPSEQHVQAAASNDPPYRPQYWGKPSKMAD
jgi:hypothetical protein